MVHQRKIPDLPRSKREIINLLAHSEVSRPIEVQFSGECLGFSPSTHYPATVRYIDTKELYVLVLLGHVQVDYADDVLKGKEATLFLVNANFTEVTDRVVTSFYDEDFGHILGFSNEGIGLRFRRYLRVPFHKRVKICIPKGGAWEELEATALNLSGSGIAIHSDVPTGLRKGALLRLAIPHHDFPGYDDAQETAILNGKVARIFAPSEGENLGIEFVFDNTSESFKQTSLIDRFCRRIAFTYDDENKNKVILDLTAELSVSLDLDSFLSKVNTAAATLVSAEASSILLFDDKKPHLYFKTATGNKAHTLSGVSLSRDTGGIAWWVAETGEPAITNVTTADPRFTGLVDRQTGFQTESLMAVPIFADGEVLGVLEAVNKKDGNKFTEVDLRLFNSLATQIGVAIQNTQMTEKYENFFSNTIELLVKAIESVGELMGVMSQGHCWRVAAATTLIGQEYNIEGKAFEDLYYAAALHDLGLLEWQHQDLAMTAHGVRGANLIKEIVLLRGITTIIRHHQEHFDGTGVPDGLTGKRIPLSSRIISVVEAYEQAILKQQTTDGALAEIQRLIGTQLDPKITDAFIRRMAQSHSDNATFDVGAGQTLGTAHLSRGIRYRKFLRVPFYEEVFLQIPHQEREEAGERGSEGAGERGRQHGVAVGGEEAGAKALTPNPYPLTPAFKEVSARALDLSGTGMAVQTNSKLDLMPGVRVQVAIPNPEFPGYDIAHGAAVLDARIVRIEKDETQPNRDNLGIEFIFSNGTTRIEETNQIDRFCRQITFTDHRENPSGEIEDLSADLDLDAILSKINAAAMKLASPDSGSMLLFEDSKLHLQFKATLGRRNVELTQIDSQNDTGGLAWWVAQSTEPTVINEVAADARFSKSLDHSNGFRTEGLIAIPIIWEGQVLGILEAINKQSNARFTELDLQFFSALANQVTIAIRNAQTRESYENFFTNAIELLVKAIESVGELVGVMTTDHCWRVTALATAVGQHFGISGKEFDNLYYAAALHDIGLLDWQHQQASRFDCCNLMRPEHINFHTVTGASMLKEICLLQEIVPIVRHHHEHFDGSGYPDALEGEAIPLPARIIALAEAYEELQFMQKSSEQTLSEIRSEAGKRFDPQVVEVFVKLIRH